jgi:putative glutamine amidotransferase
MPPLDPDLAPSYLAGLAGVCLSGGPDVGTQPGVDSFELAVVREAERLGMPLLAICRGAQVLNVAHGGDLYQDLLDDVGTSVRHQRATAEDPVLWHEVEVEPDCLLARVLGTERLEVNSFHHQAPRRVGDGLRVVARAPDGVAEALEAPDAEFEIGVQWHPEAIADRPEQAALFTAFVDAAARYAASTSSTASTAAGSQRWRSAGGAATSATGIR